MITMPQKSATALHRHSFRNKLLLNQWLISLFGISPFGESWKGETVRPFQVLAKPLKDTALEGMDADNIHHFFHALIGSDFVARPECQLTREHLLRYEENIVRHTQHINAKRRPPIVWKYYQWLSLLFTEIYLDRYFGDREQLLADLNRHVTQFNQHWREHEPVAPFTPEHLNKICLQCATGSGKTLLMHVNFLQHGFYADQHHQRNLSRAILLTPNENLSKQHEIGFRESKIGAEHFMDSRHGLFAQIAVPDAIDILEITKLADKEGPGTVAARSLGDRNLLLVDEGHRGISGKNRNKEEQVWFQRRAGLCEKGFSYEYSATFEQAVGGTGHEDDYSKSILFDYSYRWFYEDGFGKDYRILNIPESFEEMKALYLTACLLKYYQQLRIYEENTAAFRPFNIEKPLWVFVGSTVSSAKGTKEEKLVATDVVQIVQFLAQFLAEPVKARQRIETLLTKSGQDTGLLDQGNDIFDRAFDYLLTKVNAGEGIDVLHRDILKRVFQNPAGGHLEVSRVKGEGGEIALKAGAAPAPFGLINVGDAKGLSDHITDFTRQEAIPISVTESEFTGGLFDGAKKSSSPVNILIGSKKFIEGWDCWRVSTMGLMHVGKSEGAQIIQLFGRGVRLKGYAHSLKRSTHIAAPEHPPFIEELETLNVFGIEADFMKQFRKTLEDEGLPGNERRHTERIPLTVTYDPKTQLKILRPKRKTAGGGEYDFRLDGPVAVFGSIPERFQKQPLIIDWYPRIQAEQSTTTGGTGDKQVTTLQPEQLALLDYDALYFELERFKTERSWHSLLIGKAVLRPLLEDPSWYQLFVPPALLQPTQYQGVLLLQRLALELLKRYADRYYNHCRRSYLEPRLELRQLTQADTNFPQEIEYRLTIDGNDTRLVNEIARLKQELAENKELLQPLALAGSVKGCRWNQHLYEPLLHVRNGEKISIAPLALNESEYQFLEDLRKWWQASTDKPEIYLLRNMSKGRGVGFFEAGGFYPDFILWRLTPEKQDIVFIDPHGLQHEGPGSPKVQFYNHIKAIEQRLSDPQVSLHSIILSWTKYAQLQWDKSREQLEQEHVLFMRDDRAHYIEKLFALIR